MKIVKATYEAVNCIQEVKIKKKEYEFEIEFP